MTSYTKWIRVALIIGVFCIPFIPFIISYTWFFPFITGKNFTFRILIEILFALACLLALKDPAYRPRFSWVSVGVLALLITSTLSTLFSVDPVKSFWSNFERMEGLVGLIHLVAWFYIASIVLTTEQLWNRFLQVSVLASAIMGGYVLLQLGGVFAIDQGGVRTDGTFGNAIYLAVYMLFHIFFTLLLMVRERKYVWMHILYGAAIILQTIGLYYAATRSATLGLLGGLLVSALWILVFGKEYKRLRVWSFSVIAAVLVLVAGFMLVRQSHFVSNSPVLSRFASISTDETTIKSRFMIWGMASQGFMEHPIFGWGLDNFNFVFNKYYNPQMWQQEQWFDRAHNGYIDWAIAGGILGLLSFLSLFIAALWAFVRSDTFSTPERAVLIGLLAAYAFHSFFVFDNLMSSVYFFLLLLIAHMASKRDVPRTMAMTRPVSDAVYAVALPIIVVGVGVSMYFINVPGMKTASILIDGLTSTKTATDALGKASTVQKDPKENLASFDVATSGSMLGRQEAVEQLLQAAVGAATTQGVDPSVKKGFVDLATTRGAELLALRPGDARLELFYGSFLIFADKEDEGRAHLVRAHELSPGKQTIDFELGVNGYLRSGDTQNAIAVLKQAYDSTPEYPDAVQYYAMALMYGGRQAEADAVLTKSFGSPIVDSDRLLGTYTDGKMYDRVAAIWELRVQKDKTSPQNRVSLAAAYKQMGNATKSVQTLQTALQDFPQYSAQIKDAARQLGFSL